MKQLIFSFGACAAFEKLNGQNIFAALGISDGAQTIEASKLSFPTLAQLVWAGSLADDRTITIEAVEESLFSANIGEVITAISEGLSASFKTEDDGETNSSIVSIAEKATSPKSS